MDREHLAPHRLILLITYACLLQTLTCQKSSTNNARAAVIGIAGCAQHKKDGTCRICKQGYQLTRGRCVCAPGWEKRDAGCKPGPCYQKCGKTYLRTAAGSYCHCDYFCDNDGSCCGGSASKNALCPHMNPTLKKSQITDCNSVVNKQSRSIAATRSGSHQYLPGVCWCDGHCAAAGDCCPHCSRSCNTAGRSVRSQGGRTAETAAVEVSSLPRNENALLTADSLDDNSSNSSNSSTTNSSNSLAAMPAVDREADDIEDTITIEENITAVTADSNTSLARQITGEAAAAAARSGSELSDCGSHLVVPKRPANESLVGIAQENSALVQLEIKMQQCQAADNGPPAKPYIIPLHWTAGQVCRGGVCTGGKYSAALVRKQIARVNNIYARVGIQFSWNGVIHAATAADPLEISPCRDPGGRCWICQQRRHGDQVAMNVITSPIHVGAVSLGVTMYPSYFATGQMPACSNWIFIYEKTLPGLGGRSLVDGGLSDGGGTLAHEIGHALMLRHTWYEEVTASKPSIKSQCEGSASLNPYDILAGRSDGVRDTPAQSLNGSAVVGQKSDILRFVNCDVRTGAYKNGTAYSQQSCTQRVGFPQGNSYYNNVGNLMSYGDKTCLRTLTPGQGARARCALKCVRQGAC